MSRRTAVLAVIIGLPLVGCWLLTNSRDVHSHFFLGDCRIDIHVGSSGFMEPGREMIYWVSKNGSRIVQPYSFGVYYGKPSRLRFSMIACHEGKVGGIYEESDPHYLIVLFDSETGEYWPQNDGQGGYPEKRAAVVGERIVSRIKEWTLDERYRFGRFGETE